MESIGKVIHCDRKWLRHTQPLHFDLGSVLFLALDAIVCSRVCVVSILYDQATLRPNDYKKDQKVTAQ